MQVLLCGFLKVSKTPICANLLDMHKGKDKIEPHKFKRTRVADLRQGRRGKHHDVVVPIVEEIRTLPDGEAIEIPLSAFDMELVDLRSALVKAASSRGLKIATYSDDTTLFAWRRTGATRAYERATKRNVNVK